MPHFYTMVPFVKHRFRRMTNGNSQRNLHQYDKRIIQICQLYLVLLFFKVLKLRPRGAAKHKYSEFMISAEVFCLV